MTSFIKELQERVRSDFNAKFVRRSPFGVVIAALDSFKGTAEKQVDTHLDDIIATTALRTLEEVEKRWEGHEYRSWKDTISQLKAELTTNE